MRDEEPRQFDRERFRSQPLGTLPAANRPAVFWGSDRHPFYNIAKSRGDGSEPKVEADDALIANTEARLGLQLPETVKAFWKAKNGGAVAYRYLDTTMPDGSDGERVTPEGLLPLEYVVTLATLRSRITYPPGEGAWSEEISDADGLVVLGAARGKMKLLDYRERGDPALLLVDNMEESGLADALALESFDAFVTRLRKFQRR